MKKTIEETTRLLLQGTITKDEADKILLDLCFVSNRRELLIDFCATKHAKDIQEFKTTVRYGVDEYLKGN